jgi:hypothetical protein
MKRSSFKKIVTSNITPYTDFTDFGDFIETAKKVQSEMILCAVRGEQAIKEAAVSREQAIQSARELLNAKIPAHVWRRLEEKGYITREPLKWLEKKQKGKKQKGEKQIQLFAYFVAEACEKFDIKRVSGMKDLEPRIVRNLKPFEVAFGISNLRGKIRDNEKTGAYLPVGWEIIDEILQK